MKDLIGVALQVPGLICLIKGLEVISSPGSLLHLSLCVVLYTALRYGVKLNEKV